MNSPEMKSKLPGATEAAPPGAAKQEPTIVGEVTSGSILQEIGLKSIVRFRASVSSRNRTSDNGGMADARAIIKFR